MSRLGHATGFLRATFHRPGFYPAGAVSYGVPGHVRQFDLDRINRDFLLCAGDLDDPALMKEGRFD